MNKSESYTNSGLEELMNYVKSVAENETNRSYTNIPKDNRPANRQENYQNWALEELMNYIKSVAESKTNRSCENLSKQIMPVQSKLIEVEVTAIATETVQQTNGEIILGEQEEIAVAPSNAGNLMALIEDLNSSNNNLVKRVTYLSQAIAEFHQDLESYKVQFHEAESKLREKDQEIAANYQTIEKLTCEIAIAHQLVAQAQADYNEQSHQLLREKDNCRELNTRLKREQQRRLQLKVALKKCSGVPTASYQLADEIDSNPNSLEEASRFTPIPPIKPWTTPNGNEGNQIDLDWDRQPLPSQNNLDKDSLPMVAQEDLGLFDNSVTSEKLVEAIAKAEIDAIPVASPIATAVNRQPNSPSPLVYPSRPPKGRKTLAAIELPSFVS